MQLRYLATVSNSNVDKLTAPDEERVRLCNYVDVYKNDRITNDMNFMSASATHAEIIKFRLRVGDVLITKDSEDRNDIAVPAYVAETASDLVCGYHLSLVRARPSRMRGDFLFWALQSKQAREDFSNASGGVTRFGLTLDGMKSVRLVCPDLPAQKAIADFLDRETARVDQLIEKKRQFLSLASRRVEALVATAISDANVPRVRFGYAGRRVRRPVSLADKDAFVRLGLYNRGRGIFKKPPADEEDMGDSSFFFVKRGDLILSGQFAWEGAVALASDDEEGCVVSHRYPIYRGTRGVSTAYLLGLLRSSLGDFLLNDASRGSAGRNRPLNTWRLEKEKIPLPGQDLQSKVERAIQFERRLKAVTDESIDLLREFRAALITAAVTGQIDVATWRRRGITERGLDEMQEAVHA
jgi:hypothetical protein